MLCRNLRAEARSLRAHQGMSLAEIANELDISTSTARRWTLDIELTGEQLVRIKDRVKSAARRGSATMAENRRQARRTWQAEGRARARNGELLHQAGCLLYWAEGTKGRNSVELANSDVDLIRLFLRFLSNCFDIDEQQLSLCLHLYTGNGRTVAEIEQHWLEALVLPPSCLRKHTINRRPAPSSGVKTNKLPFGVCHLRVLRSTWLVQHMYGAIQEYGGFTEPRWLD